MIPLSSWLSCQWRHADKAAGYSSVLSAAQRLDDEVWERHRFKLMYLDDPCRFRDLSEKEIERANLEGAPIKGRIAA